MNEEGDKNHFKQRIPQPSAAVAASLRTPGMPRAKPETSYLAGKHEASREKWKCKLELHPQPTIPVLNSHLCFPSSPHHQRPDCFLFPLFCLQPQPSTSHTQFPYLVLPYSHILIPVLNFHAVTSPDHTQKLVELVMYPILINVGWQIKVGHAINVGVRQAPGDKWAVLWSCEDHRGNLVFLHRKTSLGKIMC